MAKLCYVLLFCLLLATTLGQKVDLTKFENDEGFKCKKDTPAMTIGDEFIGYRENLNFFEGKYDAFILGVSDSKCDVCCVGEVILHQIMKRFEKDLQHEGSSIPVVRLDVQSHADMLQGSGIVLDFLPRIYLYYQGKYYLYNEEDNLNLFIAFINRVLHPVAELTTDKQVKNFVGTGGEVIESTPFYKEKYRSIKDKFEQLPKVTRVVAFLEDSEKYADKIEELKKVALALVERTDLRVGLVTDKKLVEQYKKEAGPFWFNETSSNSIVVFREKPEPLGRQRFYDVEADDYDLKSWISFSSLDEVEELNKYSAMILQEVNMPIFCALLPEDWENDEQGKELMEGLKSAAHHYPEIMYTWTNSSDDHYLRDHMTIVWKDLPAMGLLNNEGMMPVYYPRNQPFDLENLKSFFGHFLNGTVHSSKFSLPNTNKDFGKNMPHATQIDISDSESTSKAMNDLIHEKKEKDRVVLVYDSSKKFYQVNQATFLLELTAYLFDDTKVSTVEFFYVDVNEKELPEEISNKRMIPHYQILPAGETEKDSFKTEITPTVQDLLEFIRVSTKTDLSAAFDGLGWEHPTDDDETPDETYDEVTPEEEIHEDL